VISSNQTSATTAASLPSSQQQRAPFAGTLVCASLLGIALAFCARTMLPAWALDGEFFPSSVVCSSGNSVGSPEAARTGD
jgi:hypothetical protein